MSLFFHAAAGRGVGWVVALGSAMAAALFALPLVTLHWLPWSLLLLFLIVPAAQIALTPLWRHAGVYRYHSPALFVVSRAPDEVEMHGGTAYDYLMRMRWGDRGAPARRILLGHYLDGLLGIIGEVERGRIPAGARITGTSYFFSDRTAERLGFTLHRPRRAEVLHALLDVVSLAAMYSYVRGRPAVPRVWRMKRASITAADLVRRKQVVQALRAGLTRSRRLPVSRPEDARSG
jgi:hypothetical protein